MSDTPRPRRRWRWILGLIALAGMGGLVASVVLGPGRLPPLPDPNGYDDLVAAGKMVTGDWVKAGRIDAAPAEVVGPLVAENGKALERIQVGLGRESRFPLDYSQESLDRGIEDVGAIRAAGRLLAAKARLATLQGRPQEAKEAGVDLIRLGQAGSRGGLAILAMMDMALESMGVAAINPSVDQLPAPECRELVKTLVLLSKQREPMDEIFDRDLRWGVNSKPLSMRIPMTIAWPMLKAQHQAARKAGHAAEQRVEGETRLLILRLSARAHQLETGKPPARLDEALPADLKSLATDPASGKPFRMEPGPDGTPVFSREPAQKNG